jgi:hypothetical protein
MVTSRFRGLLSRQTNELDLYFAAYINAFLHTKVAAKGREKQATASKVQRLLPITEN